MNYSFVLLGEVPSKKNKWKRGKSGNVYIPRDTKDEIDALIMQANVARSKLKIFAPLHGDISLHTIFYTRNRCDLDNILTTICDVLQSAQIIKNDREIFFHESKRVITQDPPFVSITIHKDSSITID